MFFFISRVARGSDSEDSSSDSDAGTAIDLDTTSIRRNTLDVVLLPTDFGLSVIKPFLLLFIGAAFVIAALAYFPWMEYTVLTEDMSLLPVFRTEVSTGLHKRCKTDRAGEELCEDMDDLSDLHGVHTTFTFSLVACVGSLAACAAQMGITWWRENLTDNQKNVCGVMLLEMLASVLAAVCVLFIVVTMVMFKLIEGGSASTGFFLYGFGGVFMTLGCIVAWDVAFEPARGRAPWIVVKRNGVLDEAALMELEDECDEMFW